MNVELLAPAGDFKTALAAFAAGADAVYCGLADFSARAFARNLSLEELADLVRYARATETGGRPRKVYVTFNTLVDEDDLPAAVESLSRIAQARPDAVIVQDLGIARICREYFPELELHASTQLAAHNLEGVLQLRELGFKRVVPARELSLSEISSLVKRSGSMEFECFIHGALCYSISGLCLFGAMEKGRSGNRGKCPYCCRLPWENAAGGKAPVFSMRDLRLDEDVLKLADAGVRSFKIEGRMKNELYVASAVAYYRRIIDGGASRGVTGADLETVFSRRTTKLYLEGRGTGDSVIDPGSLGHVGTPVGSVKRVTRDRDGLRWLRFHTSRALERHDGLQFDAVDINGRRLGLGIGEMRLAISRRCVFEAPAGSDVEILLPEGEEGDSVASLLKPGMKIYCSASQAVRRMFPAPQVRMSDYPGAVPLDVSVRLSGKGLSASASAGDIRVETAIDRALDAAKNPGNTEASVRKAFSRLGGTCYRLAEFSFSDDEKLFAPASVLNDLRRDLVEKLDSLRENERRGRVDAALECPPAPKVTSPAPARVIKIRSGAALPAGDWDEVVVLLDPENGFSAPESAASVRVALPVYTAEPDFNRLRTAVKGLIRRGFDKWEASDLATLRMLKALGVNDITADWTLYAFNSSALSELARLGVRRFVASPENTKGNLRYLAESGFPVEFLIQQSTPLFISLTPPAESPLGLSVYRQGGLWITVKPSPRVFDAATGAPVRVDLSWDVPG